MTVTTLPTPLTQRPGTCTRVLPLLSRDERRSLLHGLAEDTCTGTPPPGAFMPILLAAFASEALSPAQAEAKWADYLGEFRRWQGWTADDPDYRDLPWHYEADMAAALNDLLDATGTYGGDR